MEDDAETSLISISALQHYSFCPRQCGLIHLEQCFEDNVLTMSGHVVHERVETGQPSTEGLVKVERSLPLRSSALGIVGKADVVEFHVDGSIYPIEYKHGSRNDFVHNEIQLAAQILCLEEMFKCEITKGAIYHFGSRRRREIEITEQLRDLTKSTINKVREMLHSLELPPPVNDKRCDNCSLIDLCQPKIIASTDLRDRIYQNLFKDELT